MADTPQNETKPNQSSRTHRASAPHRREVGSFEPQHRIEPAATPRGYAGVSHDNSIDHVRKPPSGNLLMVRNLCIIVLLVCLGVLAYIGYTYFHGEQTYSNLAEESFSVTDPTRPQVKGLAAMTVDWTSLLDTNADTVAWIYIPNSTINYPVVKGTDNQKYLKTDFEGTPAGAIGASYGTIFMDYTNDAKFSDAVTVLYGHNMNDGSMFAEVANYQDDEYFQDNRTIYVMTPQGNYKLQTFAICHVAAADAVVQTNFATEESRLAYIQDKIDTSVVTPVPAVSASQVGKCIVLSTCDNLASDGRWLLFSYVVETTVPDSAYTTSTATAADQTAANSQEAA